MLLHNLSMAWYREAITRSTWGDLAHGADILAQVPEENNTWHDDHVDLKKWVRLGSKLVAIFHK